MREAAGGADPRRMGRRCTRAHRALGKSLYVVELSRRGLDAGRSRPPARSHLGVARPQGRYQRFPDHEGCTRLGAAVRPRAGDSDAGGVSKYVLVIPRCAIAHLRARVKRASPESITTTGSMDSGPVASGRQLPTEGASRNDEWFV